MLRARGETFPLVTKPASVPELLHPQLPDAGRRGEGRRADAGPLWQDAYQRAATLGAAVLRAAIETSSRRAAIPLDQAEADVEAPVPFGLTPRELEVLTLVAAGRTNRQIGEHLFISEKTASVHVSRILTKLGAADRREASALARRAGR